MVWLIVLGVVVLLIAIYILLYNGIIQAYNKCDAAWQTINAQLQRRNDLIPNLVETVRGYAKHESETLQSVTNARAAVMSAKTPEEKMDASSVLSQTLGHLFAVAEQYPQLKANQNFQQLQSELSDTENRISYARMSYNDVVMDYNNAIATFPGVLVAKLRPKPFQPRVGFELTDPSAAQVPQVKF